MVSYSHWGMFPVEVAGLANFREHLDASDFTAVIAKHRDHMRGSRTWRFKDWSDEREFEINSPLTAYQNLNFGPYLP